MFGVFFGEFVAQAQDNDSQAGLQVQKPFCSQWENVLDTFSSSFVLYVAICASCRVEGLCLCQARVHRDHWNRWAWRKLVWVQWGDLSLVTSQAVYCRDAGKM